MVRAYTRLRAPLPANALPIPLELPAAAAVTQFRISDDPGRVVVIRPDADGNPGDKQTVGLLQRRHGAIDHIRYIGKESNGLEDVEAGLIHSESATYTEYPDPRHDEWETKVLPALQSVPPSVLTKMTSHSLRAIMYARRERRLHRKNRDVIIPLLRKPGVMPKE